MSLAAPGHAQRDARDGRYCGGRCRRRCSVFQPIHLYGPPRSVTLNGIVRRRSWPEKVAAAASSRAGRRIPGRADVVTPLRLARKLPGTGCGVGLCRGVGSASVHEMSRHQFRRDDESARQPSFPMITVHHLNQSRSQRILWLLEELGLNYEVQRHERDPASLLAPAALREIHPLGKSPVIVDDGQCIAESGAITEYLVERYAQGRLAPAAGTPERLRYTYWLHYAEGSAMPPLVLKLIFSHISRQPMPWLIRPVAQGLSQRVIDTFIDPQLETHLDYLESELQRSEWFAGSEFSAADVLMSFPVEGLLARNGKQRKPPKLSAYLQRIHARPAYQRALQRGGPFALLD